MKFGAIDVGTNAARLLIGEVVTDDESSYVKKLSYTRVPLRLGEEVFENGVLSENKIQAFEKTLNAFRLLTELYEVKAMRACATSAMREARNGLEVQHYLTNATGVQLEVISGEEEAKLIFDTFFLLDIDLNTPFVVVDVGGGSTEISVFENGARVAAHSFQVGTLRILKGKVETSNWKEIQTWIQSHVDLSREHTCYATGGNINKAQKMLGIKPMREISIKKLKALHDNLEKYSVSERIQHFQLKPDRADVLVPALDIYLFILKTLGSKGVFVPKIGLSDGIIYQLYTDNIHQD
jgi:exopolyphosphatase / guanosine-5'-triphosphate,3'-diphosphate pyrophosphatase